MDTCCWKMKRFQSAYQKLKSQQDLYKKSRPPLAWGSLIYIYRYQYPDTTA